MSGFVVIILVLGLFANEIKSETFGLNFKSEEKLSSKPLEEVPNYWTRWNSMSSPENKLESINGTGRFGRSVKTTTTTRQAKFLPKISILAGLNIGSSSMPRLIGNLTPIARISQANSSPPFLNPYFAATYEPSTGSMQQSIQALYRVVEHLTSQVNNLNKRRDNSAESSDELFTSVNVNDAIDDRRRNKNKIKSTKSGPKRRKQDKIMGEKEEDANDDEEMQSIKMSQRVSGSKTGSKTESKKKPSAKQTNLPSTTTPTSVDTTTTDATNTTGTNATTDQGNTTYSNNPGYYYGGNPQNVGQVSFTYDRPQETYGAPSDNYGPPMSVYGSPSYSYGPPSYTYGSPSYTYGAPSRGYGPPSQAYEVVGPHASFHDHETVIYDDPNESSFGPQPSERWQQRLPFARSRNIGTTTPATKIANGNGFVPML